MSEKKKGGSKTLTAAEKGAITALYTKTGYCVSVYPALDIYKVKWSFFKQGDKEAAFDIYMEVPTFIDLIESINDRTKFGLAARIEAERAAGAKYPSAWTSGPMGPEGGNTIAIGASSKGGIVLQGRSKAAEANAFIPVASFVELKDLARTSDHVLKTWNEETRPDGISGWFYDRVRRILSAMAEAAKFRKGQPAEEEYVPDEIPEFAEAKEEEVPGGFKEIGGKPVSEPSEPAPEATPETEQLTAASFSTRGAFFEKKGKHLIKAVDKNGDEAILIFGDEGIKALGEKWGQLNELASKRAVLLTVNGKKRGNQIIFESLAS